MTLILNMSLNERIAYLKVPIESLFSSEKLCQDGLVAGWGGVGGLVAIAFEFNDCSISV